MSDDQENIRYSAKKWDRQERIKYLVGVRNALNTRGEVDIGLPTKIVYDAELIEQLIATVDTVLKLDGIVGIPADSKV